MCPNSFKDRRVVCFPRVVQFPNSSIVSFHKVPYFQSLIWRACHKSFAIKVVSNVVYNVFMWSVKLGDTAHRENKTRVESMVSRATEWGGSEKKKKKMDTRRPLLFGTIVLFSLSTFSYAAVSLLLLDFITKKSIIHYCCKSNNIVPYRQIKHRQKQQSSSKRIRTKSRVWYVYIVYANTEKQCITLTLILVLE